MRIDIITSALQIKRTNHHLMLVTQTAPESMPMGIEKKKRNLLNRTLLILHGRFFRCPSCKRLARSWLSIYFPFKPLYQIHFGLGDFHLLKYVFIIF